MSGVMSPVGPEEPRVYWVRRGIVAVVLLALVITVVAAVNAVADGGKSAGEPPPGESTSTGPSLQPAESSSPETPAASGTPTTTASPSDGASPSASDQSGSPQSSGTQSDATDPKASESTPDESSSSSKPAGPVACDGKDVTVNLDGPTKVSHDKPVTFKISLTNSGTTECKITADADSYELRIYSGTDRIWTTGQCAPWVKAASKTLKPKESVSLEQGWRVVRSKGCADHPAKLKPGTYAANAEFSGAKPSQIVMQLS